MLNLNSNMEGLFHVLHESKKSRNIKYTKEVTTIYYFKNKKKTERRIFTRNIIVSSEDTKCCSVLQ